MAWNPTGLEIGSLGCGQISIQQTLRMIVCDIKGRLCLRIPQIELSKGLVLAADRFGWTDFSDFDGDSSLRTIDS
jgi:hypothetical protein